MKDFSLYIRVKWGVHVKCKGDGINAELHGEIFFVTHPTLLTTYTQ